MGFEADEVAVRTKIDLPAILQMRKLMLQNRIDVVHTHLSTSSVNGCLAARLARIPCVATVHGMSGKLSFAAADRMIAVSEQVKGHLIAQGVPSEKVHVVYNGIEFGEMPYDAETARHDLGFGDAGPILGTVARIVPEKGIEDALRVVANLKSEFPGMRYLVVGDGDGRPACENLARELGLEEIVRFAGYQENVAPYLAAMDLFLFPSHKEAMGIALVEAMAAGLPVVASRIGGIPEVVTPETGLLRPARDIAGMTEATAGLLRDLPRRFELGANAHLRATSIFSAQAMATATDAVYDELIGVRKIDLRVTRPGVRV